MRHLALLSVAALGLTPFGLSAQQLEAPPVDLVPSLAPPSQSVMTVAERVAADWPRYDLGGKDHLTKAELGRWLADLRIANKEPPADAKWLDAAFAQTDTNKDQKVTREELTASLSSGR